MRRKTVPVVTAALLIASAGCGDGFYQVTDPDVLESTNIDPVRDGETLARSAFQNFAEAYANLAVYTGWWSNEARVGDTFPTRNEFGRRQIDDRNGTLNAEVWSPLARAASTSQLVVTTLQETPGLPLALASFAEGYSMLLMAESFCEGTVAASATEPGPKMSTQEMLDLAIERLQQSRDQALAVADNEEAVDIATAALVGIARANLQAGNGAAAIAAATQVPADFEYDVEYVDDPANRNRLGNTVWNFSLGRTSLVVGPEYRAIADSGDPRVSYEDTGILAQDSELEFYRQLKFPTYGDPIRLASGLEARYIVAEAGGDVNAQLALVAERRAVGNQGAFTSTDPAAVLKELYEQRARDFWLEGKKMGDYARHPEAVPYFLPDGSAYYKEGVGAVGTQKCFPVPADEKDNNPNWS